MLNNRFQERGTSFIERFFEPDKIALDFFLRGFVKPRRFDEFVHCMRPEVGLKKVLLVDGHPRTGKTWVAVGAAATLIDEETSQIDHWWTSGADSLAVCDIDDSLPEAFKKTSSQLQPQPSPKLVVLNDLLGTNSLRDLGDYSARRTLHKYLQWNAENPWLSAMSEGSTLVLVERSMFLTLIETLMNIDIRGLAGRHRPAPGIKVVRWRHGFFRRKEDGAALGAFDSTMLEELSRINLDLHPLRDRRRLYSNAPLAAVGDWKDLKPYEKDTPSWSAFGGDLKSIARMIEKMEAKRGTTLDELDSLYLILLAPALVFLGPNAYESLGLDVSYAELLRRKLFLDLESEDDERYGSSGRIPNEFYIWALREHIQERLPLLVRVCQRRTQGSKLQQQETTQQRTIGLFLRGIVEQALNSDNQEYRLKEVTTERAWKTILGSFKSRSNGHEDAKEDPWDEALLSIEGAFGKKYRLEEKDLRPGVAAAVGWIIYRSLYDDEELRRTVREWFQRSLQALIRQWAITADSQEKDYLWDRISGSFSPLLQWALRGWREKKGNPKELEQVEEIWRSLSGSETLSSVDPNGTARDLLRMILEDELTWGRIYDPGKPVGEGAGRTSTEPDDKKWSAPGVQEIFGEVLRFLEERPGRNGPSTDPFRIANRIFSLAWHNEWKPIAGKDGVIGDKVFARQAKEYFYAFKGIALDLMRKNPSLLDVNLQYHWVHFVTQHAVWMRDWCFEPDPDDFERGRAAPGSSINEDNDELLEILSILLRTAPPKQRVRNCFLLAGMRAQRLRNLPDLTGTVSHLLQQDRTGQITPDIVVGVLQAIFELMRQGYYDRLSNREAAGLSGTHWDEWSQRQFVLLEAKVETAWTEYWQELHRLSHPFDLLPSQKRGWEQLIPWHWRR